MGLTKSRGRLALLAAAVLTLCLYSDWLAMYVMPLVVGLLAFGGAREFHRLAAHCNIHYSLATASVGALGAVLLGAIAGPDWFWPSAGCWLLILTMISFVSHMAQRGIDGALSGVSSAVFSTIYIGIPLALSLQILQEDRLFLLFGMSLVWAADSGAYFFGMRYGKRRLAPTLSPKKSIEGALGGVVTCMLFAAVFKAVVPDEAFGYSYGSALLLAFLASVVSPAGDLAESVLKRDSGVKDSGRGMGGHGGVLDRVDSLLFCLPIYYMFLLFSGKLTSF